MKVKELVDWAKALRVPEEFRKKVGRPYEFGLVLQETIKVEIRKIRE